MERGRIHAVLVDWSQVERERALQEAVVGAEDGIEERGKRRAGVGNEVVFKFQGRL